MQLLDDLRPRLLITVLQVFDLLLHGTDIALRVLSNSGPASTLAFLVRLCLLEAFIIGSLYSFDPFSDLLCS